MFVKSHNALLSSQCPHGYGINKGSVDIGFFNFAQYVE